jgi:hypothetical protein
MNDKTRTTGWRRSIAVAIMAAVAAVGVSVAGAHHDGVHQASPSWNKVVSTNSPSWN